MCIVKDLLTKEELRHLRSILEILPEEAPISHEVWIVGYSDTAKSEVLLRSFTESADAIKYAKTVTFLEAINALAADNHFSYNTDCVYIEVDTVMDNNKGNSVNIGTVFKNMFFILEDIG